MGPARSHTRTVPIEAARDETPVGRDGQGGDLRPHGPGRTRGWAVGCFRSHARAVPSRLPVTRRPSGAKARAVIERSCPRRTRGLAARVLQVPHPRRMIGAARDEPTVGRKGHGVDRADVSRVMTFPGGRGAARGGPSGPTLAPCRRRCP